MIKAAVGGTRRKRILLVDDHPVVRLGLRALLEDEADLEVSGEAGTMSEALRAFGECHPDMLTVDLALGGGDGLDLIKNIRALDPRVPILVISMFEETSFAERVLRAGGNGYLMKE